MYSVLISKNKFDLLLANDCIVKVLGTHFIDMKYIPSPVCQKALNSSDFIDIRYNGKSYFHCVRSSRNYNKKQFFLRNRNDIQVADYGERSEITANIIKAIVWMLEIKENYQVLTLPWSTISYCMSCIKNNMEEVSIILWENESYDMEEVMDTIFSVMEEGSNTGLTIFRLALNSDMSPAGRNGRRVPTQPHYGDHIDLNFAEKIDETKEERCYLKS